MAIFKISTGQCMNTLNPCIIAKRYSIHQTHESANFEFSPTIDKNINTGG